MMSVSQFVKLFETVGIPVLTAAAAGYALWWLIRWLTGSFKEELNNEHKDIVKAIDILKEELDEETRDTRDLLGKRLEELRIMMIRLIDRVRVLEMNFIEHYEGFDVPPEYPYFDKFMDYWNLHIPSIILEIKGMCHLDISEKYVHLYNNLTFH